MSIQLFAPEPMPAGFLAPRGSRDNRRASAFMTLNAGNITDGIRQDTPLSGDGVSPGSFMGMWPAATNLCTNGGFETNTTGATALSASISRVTAQAKFGVASCEVVTSNAVANEGVYETFTGTVAIYVASAWVRGAGGGTVRMCVADDATGAVRQVGTAVTLTTTWQRITLTTTNLTVATYRCQVETNSQQNITFQVDGLQVEAGVLSQSTNIATPYIETNGGTAARTIGGATYPSAAFVTAGQGWCATRLTIPYASTALPFGDFRLNLFRWVNGSGVNDFTVYYRDSLDAWQFIRYNSSTQRNITVASTWSANATKTVIASWTTTTINISVDGGNFATLSFGASTPTMAATIPSTSTPDDPYNMFWQACGTGTLSNSDSAAIHALGNIGNVPAMFPGACKIYWQCLNAKALTAT